MKRTLVVLLAVSLLSATVLASCSSNEAVVDGTTDTVTETVVTDETVEENLSESGAKDRTEPLPSDFAFLIPSPERLQELSLAAGGEYEPARDRMIPAYADTLPWATGLLSGFERVYDFQSVNDDDPMQTHAAKMVVRMLVFDTPDSASSSLQSYQREMGRAVVQTNSLPGGKFANLLYDKVGEALPRISERLTQQGSMLVWVVFQDSSARSWLTQTAVVSNALISNIAARYPALTS